MNLSNMDLHKKEILRREILTLDSDTPHPQSSSCPPHSDHQKATSVSQLRCIQGEDQIVKEKSNLLLPGPPGTLCTSLQHPPQYLPHGEPRRSHLGQVRHLEPPW